MRPRSKRPWWSSSPSPTTSATGRPGYAMGNPPKKITYPPWRWRPCARPGPRPPSCPACQLRSGLPAFHLRPLRAVSGKPSLARLYTTPVQDDFDDIRNCPHCREDPRDRSCPDWEEARRGVRTLRREARRIAREVTELQEATGGRPATIYQFADGSVGYFAFPGKLRRDCFYRPNGSPQYYRGPDLAGSYAVGPSNR